MRFQGLEFNKLCLRFLLDGNIYGGVYYFTSRSAIDDYLLSELWTGFEGDSNTNVYKKDIYMVAPISTISNGVPVL